MCGLLGSCFKTSHSKPYVTNTMKNLYLAASKLFTSAHAPSEKTHRILRKKMQFPIEQNLKNTYNLWKNSKSAPQKRFGNPYSCIGNEHWIPCVYLRNKNTAKISGVISYSFNTLIQRKRRIQVLVMQRFQAHVTLFSKYFASFPHGTCSLSDSRRYLALDEIYHPISAPIPGNATL